MRGKSDSRIAAELLQSKIGNDAPKVAVILGSGLQGLAAAVDDAVRVPYADIPGFPQPTVSGHGGELVFGLLEQVPVLMQSGRFHSYEGHAPQTVALPVRTFADMGVEILIVTNAAGGIRPTFTPPLLMLIADHVNYMWRNPLLGPKLESEERFPDMSEPYDAKLRELARDVALEEGVTLEEGVYAAVLGPSYETPAEIRMLAIIGADAVGMSTVPEVVVARARGMRVLGISAITNLAAGIANVRLNHEEVLAAGAAMSENLEVLVRGVVREL
ncbi:MAG: purine-nucleoside phosphorylase [Gemmatimonadetes bacterium]|nr:purine-nucleoside phosphorylase [Gemmatimonadota bacterium]